uniref:Serine hydrolase domain-containing protein n=1 Tax=Alexandrium monilatum TaxID=311494 RepID=A0A7S4UZH4_9DINO
MVQVWQVVGGAAAGGILVREGKELDSAAQATRLATGALVREEELAEGRLRYVLLRGTGPGTGWVSVGIPDKALAVRVQLWEVVGGAAAGGILVRAGRELDSEAQAARLATGAVVREEELIEGRLRYAKITGAGPETGWVSIGIPEKSLLVKTDKVSAGADRPPRKHLPSVEGRRVRVLVLHGAPGNSNVMKFQVKTLQKMAGDDFEWIFVDGPCAWEPIPGSQRMNFAERSEFERKLAKDKPFVQWYAHPDESRGDVYVEVEECIKYLDECISREGPVDALLCYSQSATAAALLMDSWRRDGKEPTWRINVFFCGAMIDDKRYQLKAPFSIPTMYVPGGDNDPWGRHGLDCLPEMYTDLTILEHTDGHTMPTSQPRAGEIYERILRELREVCGLPPLPGKQPTPAARK